MRKYPAVKRAVGKYASMYMPIGMCIGIGIGMCFGNAIFDNLAIGMSFGVGVGLSLGCAYAPSMDTTASILTMNLPMPLLSNQAITVATGQTTGQTTGLSSLAARMTIKNMKIFSFKHYAMVWTN